MRTVIIILCLLLTVGCCYASTYRFSFYYEVRGANPDVGGGGKIIFSSSGTDGYDWDAELPQNPLPLIHAGIRKVNGVHGWDGPTEFYIVDYRAPLLDGQRKTEDIFIWADTGAYSQDILLYLHGPPYLSPGVSYQLSLVNVPNGVTYTGPKEWGPDHGTITLPFYSTDDPLTGYRFLAEVTAIPEPSSILALAGGLVGLAGFALRRRARRCSGS